MKNLVDNFKFVLRALEAPITFSIVLVFFQGLLEIFEISNFLFLDSNELVLICSYLLLFIYFFPKYKKLSISRSKNNKKNDISKIIKCIVIGCLFSIIFNICLQYVLNVLFKQDVVATTEGMRFSIIYLFIVCIIGPCIEELCYRGMVLRVLDKKFNKNFIIIFSSIIFALGHYSSLGNVLYAFILGCFMMLIYIKNKSLLYSILFHIGANVTSVVLEFFPRPSITNIGVYLVVLFLTISTSSFMLIKNKKLYL